GAVCPRQRVVLGDRGHRQHARCGASRVCIALGPTAPAQSTTPLCRKALRPTVEAMYTMNELLRTLPQRGRVQWIGLRPGREQPMVAVQAVDVEIGSGLVGDRYKGNAESKRQVTLIQAEHLVALGSLLGRAPIDPVLLRRNIVVTGINLLALHQARFRIGSVLLEGTG